MFTGFFRDRSRTGSVRTARDALGRVLRAPGLRTFRFDPNCEVGPFIVDFLCRERSLIVELQRSEALGPDARTTFLTGMGYVVVQVSRRELRTSPGKVVGRLRTALGGERGGRNRAAGSSI
jgi:very-short-patch-repair endonuclease